MPSRTGPGHPRPLSRRDFLATASAAAGGLVLAGCAKNPVTGKSQLMLVDEGDERAIDKDSRMFTGPVFGKGYPADFVKAEGIELPKPAAIEEVSPATGPVVVPAPESPAAKAPEAAAPAAVAEAAAPAAAYVTAASKVAADTAASDASAAAAASAVAPELPLQGGRA